jgi:butyryl-CoA dehydrogenase
MSSLNESSIPEFPIVAAAGGSFLLESRTPAEVFTPEDLSEEQRQIGDTAAQFAREEILPVAAAIEAREPGVMKGLLRKAAELGLTSVDIPEDYGGVGMEKTVSALVVEKLSVMGSFATALGAHTGIGTLPLVWYGTEDQKQRYLPRLASGEWVGAYALSESSSGSDALNVRAKATLSADGRHYLLNGEKMWISNGGIADLFTVFAKIDGEKFTAFLIERQTPGLTVGPEEHKLGIRGSSTCPLVLADCKVPVENLLGEVGKGHQIAFNVLNVGRLKMGAATVGGSRLALGQMVRYAKERVAFGKTISEFGLIQRKISTCAARLYATEAMSYRTVGMIDAALRGIDSVAQAREVPRRIEEYSIECSMVKVYGSEMLSLMADELVATMGGYGYVEEFPAERIYRDARINRIFEGTNEINRLIVSGTLMKRAMGGQLPLLKAIKNVMDEAMEPPSLGGTGVGSGPLAHEAEVLVALKKVGLFAAGVASQRFLMGLSEQQEIMADLADIFIQIYALESTVLRGLKLTEVSHPFRKESGKDGAPSAANRKEEFARAACGLLAEESMGLVEQAARRVLAACGEGDGLQTQLMLLRRFARVTPANALALSRSVAKLCSDANGYPL